MIPRITVLLCVAALLSGQQQAQEPEKSDKTFSSDVRLVNVFATVRDKKGAISKDLTQDDFTIDEDGKPQTIKFFTKEANVPLTLGILVDTSGSMRRLIETERSASFKFLDQVLRDDKDKAFLIHFDSQVELLEDVTGSRQLLQKALSELAPSPDQQSQRNGNGNGSGYPNGGGNGPYGRQRGGGAGRGGGTALYDSILLASNEVMKNQKGRKAIILLTDGDDNGSKSTMTEAISAAQRADTMVYAIRFSDSQGMGSLGGFSAPGMGRRGGGRQMPQQQGNDGKKVLQRIALETGGGYFEGGKKDSLDDLYHQIQEELRNQYSLGYTSNNASGPGYRALRVLTKKKDLIVQARDGYYADK